MAARVSRKLYRFTVVYKLLNKAEVVRRHWLMESCASVVKQMLIDENVYPDKTEYMYIHQHINANETREVLAYEVDKTKSVDSRKLLDRPKAAPDTQKAVVEEIKVALKHHAMGWYTAQEAV